LNDNSPRASFNVTFMAQIMHGINWVAIWVWYPYKIKFIREITPRNWKKARSSTEELGMHFINNYNGLENRLSRPLLLIQVLFKLEQIYIRLVICFPHRRLSSFFNIDQICCTVPYSLHGYNCKQCIRTSGYIAYIL
jgi:hypothetical protein